MAGGLRLLRKRSLHPVVFTGQRPFPAASVTRETFLEMIKPVPVADYAGVIATRMYALEQSEAPPRVMPLVLMEWGLEPRTSRAEILDLTNLIPPQRPAL